MRGGRVWPQVGTTHEAWSVVHQLQAPGVIFEGPAKYALHIRSRLIYESIDDPVKVLALCSRTSHTFFAHDHVAFWAKLKSC